MRKSILNICQTYGTFIEKYLISPEKSHFFFIHKDVSRVVKLVLIKKQRMNKYILDFIRLCNKNYRLF